MPTPNDVVSRAWASYQAGMLAIEDVRAIQAAMMPACDLCDPLYPRRALGIVDGRAMCPECYARMLGAEIPSAEPLLVRSVRP